MRLTSQRVGLLWWDPSWRYAMLDHPMKGSTAVLQAMVSILPQTFKWTFQVGYLYSGTMCACAPYQFTKHLSIENFCSIGECLPLENDPLNSDFPSVTLTWPETDINVTHSHPCPCLDNLSMGTQQPVVTRRCGENQTSGARWQPVDYSQCGFNDAAFQLCATELVWGQK